MKKDDSQNIYAERAARVMDQNHDGCLQVSEYDTAVKLLFHRKALHALSEGRSDAADIHDLRNASGKSFKEAFVEMRETEGKYFPNGMETPSDAEFNKLAELAHQTARDNSAMIAKSTAFDRMLARGELFKEDLEIGVEVLFAPKLPKSNHNKDQKR